MGRQKRRNRAAVSKIKGHCQDVTGNDTQHTLPAGGIMGISPADFYVHIHYYSFGEDDEDEDDAEGQSNLNAFGSCKEIFPRPFPPSRLSNASLDMTANSPTHPTTSKGSVTCGGTPLRWRPRMMKYG